MYQLKPYSKTSIMSNLVRLTVKSSKLTSKGTYLNKLVNIKTTTVDTAFGANSQSSQSTYYMFTDQMNTVGTTGELDLDKFDVVTEQVEMEIDGEIKNLSLKKLYPKR